MKKLLIIASVFAATAFTASTFVSADESEKTKALVAESTALLEKAVSSEGIVSEAIEVSFKTIDKNQDNVISIEEAGVNDMLLESFMELDLDKTEDLTKAEYSKFSAMTK